MYRFIQNPWSVRLQNRLLRPFCTVQAPRSASRFSKEAAARERWCSMATDVVFDGQLLVTVSSYRFSFANDGLLLLFLMINGYMWL